MHFPELAAIPLRCDAVCDPVLPFHRTLSLVAAGAKGRDSPIERYDTSEVRYAESDSIGNRGTDARVTTPRQLQHRHRAHFRLLEKGPIGDELTFGYTYENSRSHGFLHTAFGEHTESAGVTKNFSLPKTKAVTGYTWIQSGITSYTGNVRKQNRLASGVLLGAIVHLNNSNSIWPQESYSKVVTVPWYTTSCIGYTYSW